MSRDKHDNKRQYSIRGAVTRRKRKRISPTSGGHGKPGFTWIHPATGRHEDRKGDEV